MSLVERPVSKSFWAAKRERRVVEGRAVEKHYYLGKAFPEKGVSD